MMSINRFLTPARSFAASLISEGLAPGRAAGAVFVGIFIAHVPIYGFQAVAAIGLAVYFGLNKPLTLAATFINNPLFQPFLIGASVVLGQFILTGEVRHFVVPELSAKGLKDGFSAWLIGTIVLGAILGGVGALLTYIVLRLKMPTDVPRRERARFVNQLFAKCAGYDRGFVRWKLRLDRIFGILAAEDLGSGAAVDLGCGHGIALGFAAFEQPGRRLVGCDLNRERIAAAQQAFAGMNADFSVADVRNFELPRAGLILILDVLQYLTADEQVALVGRCCSALEPSGKFILRVHDRERGMLSRLSLGFDRIIFLVGGARQKPLMLSAPEYRTALERAGMRIEERRFRNLLPLAHIVFIARKP
jgi:uncharacterized protein (DUF2062 family)/2-polyprenyl-3-methyl-5-hydroxy-6-metoxy-1,4-benzoquinol methylase